MHTISQNQRHEAEQVDIFPRTKIQHIDTRNSPVKWASACIMHHNEKCHGIGHRIIIWRIIVKLLENDSIRNGPLTTANTGDNSHYSNKQHRKWNSKTKNIQSNRYEILLGTR